MKLQDRREEYRESLRDDILDAARQLFVQDGFEATSMRGIAAKVGCSPGILYHYFEDKQAIMAILVQEAFAQMRTRLNAIRLDSTPVSDRLRRGLRAYIEFGLDHPHHYSLLFMKSQNLEGKEAIRDAFQKDGALTFACLQHMSAEALATGMLRPELTDPEELAQVLWAAIHGMVSVQIGAKGFPFLERTRLTDRLVDILMHGIVP